MKSAEASQSMHALGRLGEPADVASCITWLLDPANAWVTGQVIGVDGGLASLRTRLPSERTHPVSEFILLVHLAATLVMVGVIWFVQVVHYTRLSNGFDAVTHRRLVRCN